MNIYEKIKQACGSTVQLCVVSKYRSPEQIMHYYNLNERIFGENKAQELIKKAPLLPNDIEWHFIGHLQTNKVKEVVPYVSCIQSVDRIDLVKEIQKQAAKYNKIMDCFVQFNLANEDTKSGISYEDAIPFIDTCNSYPNIRIIGIMCMGPHVEDETRIKEVFHEANSLFLSLQEKYGKDKIKVLSMGMSHDYPIAIEEGSTMIRIGTSLFENMEEK